MPFKAKSTPLGGVIEIETTIFHDERGYFLESYKLSDFQLIGIEDDFVQDNHSYSIAGVLRGLHYQKRPYAQGKLVTVISGRILDVAVDLRLTSPTFSMWYSTELSDENNKLLWIPKGYAHGFVALENSHVLYKVTAEYNKEAESGIVWNDSKLNIDWRISNPSISKKDALLPNLDSLIGLNEKEII